MNVDGLKLAYDADDDGEDDGEDDDCDEANDWRDIINSPAVKMDELMSSISVLVLVLVRVTIVRYSTKLVDID